MSLASFGMTLVGNFQLENNEQIHNFGTSMTFGLGTLFRWVQSFITLKVNLRNEGCRTGITRLLLSGAVTVCMVLCFIIGVLRYLQLKHQIQKSWLNIGCLMAMSLASFGMTLVGNFQLRNDEQIHNFGTFMTFGLGTLFCWVQSFITLKVNLRNEGCRTGITRLLLSGAVTVCMVLYFALLVLRLHMHAARAQWALVTFFLGFLATFSIEFRHYRYEVVCTDDHEPPSGMSVTFSEVSQDQPDQLVLSSRADF
ncbi:hypothetical protein DPEC_G00334410 [Dallia pectoralis]|uniref:Uncharacterized protein n=1 Tax=Dallia pectoralis TaxID=75939 RepID=A0ACC2F6P4_DALPE|nr:hypothetical protein DPEC_G00334410 [Dallia pectoralis]